MVPILERGKAPEEARGNLQDAEAAEQPFTSAPAGSLRRGKLLLVSVRADNSRDSGVDASRREASPTYMRLL